jgi:hypothetical protein
LTYTWKSGATTLETGATYVVQASDIGKTITVEITSSVESGTVTSAATSAVNAAPEVNNAIFTGAEWFSNDEETKWFIRLTGMTGIQAGSNFDISKMIYSNDKTSYSLGSDVGNPYVQCGDINSLTYGSYFYSSSTSTLTIMETISDNNKKGTGSTSNEKISALEGWNVNNTVPAGAVVWKDLTYNW